VLPVDEALKKLLAGAKRVGHERVPLAAVHRRVLAAALTTASDLPRHDLSTMDGYALAVADLAGVGPWRLSVAGESRAGQPPPDLVPATACRIFTGAALPLGADAVVPQEIAPRDGDRIVLEAPVTKGACIRRAGDDLRAGTVALEAGARLGPGAIALAGMLDRPELVVARHPVVTILSTGDELRAPGDAPRAASIPESNGPAIAALANHAGAVAHLLPLARDDRAETARAVREALRTIDLLVTIGGVSVGDHDVVRPALTDAGVALDFWRVAMRPGKPLAVGRTDTAHVLGLPGNPASALVTFALFGVPLLRAMQGDAAPLPPWLPAVWNGAPPRAGENTEFVRVGIGVGPDRTLTATPFANQASGAATSLAASDGLARLLPGSTARAVDVVRWSDL
jgi:molybdopterin molybdotransferase